MIMRNIKLKNAFLALLSGLAIVSCDKYNAEEAFLNVNADKTTVAVGEKVNFSISTNTSSTIVYNGTVGHNYEKSADYLLKGLSQQELKDSIYRIPNELVKRFFVNLSGAESIPETIEYPDMQIAYDDSLAANALKLTLFPNDWGKVLKIYPRVAVADNKNLTIRMRFDSNDIYYQNGGEWLPGSTKANFRIVTEVIGKTSDGTVKWDFDQNSPNSLWYNNTITPSTKYFNHIVNIEKWIQNWEAKNGLTLETVECITMKFVGDANAAYKGNIYIASIELGEDGYYAFDTGECVTSLNGSGKMSYSCSFDQPGTYNVTFVTTTSSSKNYSGDGYQSDRNDISSDEYKYNTKYVTIPIVVE